MTNLLMQDAVSAEFGRAIAGLATAISIRAISIAAVCGEVGAFEQACFSSGSNGQIMASDVTSRSSGAPSIASQSATDCPGL